MNPLLLADFYKESHADLYDKDTQKIYATWTPRKSLLQNVDKAVVFGFQYFVKKYLIEYFNEYFFKRDKEEVVSEYLRIMRNTIGNDGLGKERIEALHDLGYLPVRIDAMEEGLLCPIRVPCMTIENTSPEFFWVTNFLETIMSTEVWKPITSATIAFEYRKLLDSWAEKTCDNNEHVKFQGHDFSMRGMAGLDAAQTSGAGHLLSFSGTDTIPAICFLEKYYNANVENELVGTSIPATEHSIMCCNSAFEEDGGKLKELEAFRRIIKDVYPNGLVSIVSDTWNLWEVCTSILPALKDDVLSRDGKVVIRPDSGNPVDIICGKVDEEFHPVYYARKKKPDTSNPYWEQEQKGVVELLWDVFGGTENEKGYKVLDSHIGCIYGDAITLDRANEICKRLEEKGFASSNIVFGIGSYTYQMNTRDTLGQALKSTYAIKDGKEVFLYKDPITDDGTKKSQKGMVVVGLDKELNEVTYYDGINEAIREETKHVNLLRPLFENGKLLRDTSLSEVRERLLGSINNVEPEEIKENTESNTNNIQV